MWSVYKDGFLKNLAQYAESTRSRSRYIFMAHGARKYLAGGAILVATTGLLLNILRQNGGAPALANAPVTHPFTAVAILIIGVVLIRSRALRRLSKSEVYILFGLIAVLSAVIVDHMVFPVNFTAGSHPYGFVGTDTALCLVCCCASILLRHRAPRIGLAVGLFAAVTVTASILGHSFGQRLFEGQMASLTLLALCSLLLGVWSLYARHKIGKAVLLAGPVGTRTRFTLLVGFAVPWLGGILLYRVVGLETRTIPYEALTIGATILSISAVAITSGVFHERVDGSRRRMARKLLELATLDSLTKTLNRHGIAEELSNRWTIFRELKRAQCVMIIDLDHFKQINDEFGHDEGDRVLAAMRKQMQPCLRTGDALGRWGGEEFLVLIDDIDVTKAELIAERLRQAVSCIPVRLNNRTDGITQLRYRTSASIGVAFFEARDTNPQNAIKRADLALYEAKASGRNRVVFEVTSQAA